MRSLRTLALAGLVAGLAAGCSRPAAPSGSGSGPPNNSAAAEKSADKRPRFDCELVYSLEVGGAKTSGSHRAGRNEGDRFKSTHTVGKGNVSLELAFEEHYGGKDIYTLIYTVTDDRTTQSRTSRTFYDGKRVVLFEDKYGTAALQPVSETAGEKK